MTECGRDQSGYLLCRVEPACRDCPLNNPLSDQEREIAATRKDGE